MCAAIADECTGCINNGSSSKQAAARLVGG
jgi:hypothetical protein